MAEPTDSDSQPGGNRKRRSSPIYLDHASAEDTRPGVLPRPDASRRIAFGWYGGKFSHLGWLLPLLPNCHHYCEPFSGSGAVLLNREPSPLETYNDLDGNVVHFFKVLRDHREELMQACALTPFSREEYYGAVHGAEGLSEVERARRFFIRARQTRMGLAQTAVLCRWANCKQNSSGGMASAIARWLGGVEGLGEVAERLLRVQIENRPAVDAIRLYDSPDTLFYCDPPYVHSSRTDLKAYAFEMDDEQHRELAAALNSIQGKAALSGYRCDLMDELFKGWQRYDAPARQIASTKAMRQESLWANYDLEALMKAAAPEPNGELLLF